MISISKEDLSDEEFETIISSRGFQKMLLYQRLADGIEIVRTHDRLYESMVEAITEQHSEIDSAETIEEVLSLLEEEISLYTESLSDSSEDELPPIEEIAPAPDDSDSDVVSEPDETETERALREYLESRLAETNELQIKAKEIASDTGLSSYHIGGILGQWRHSDDPPFAITASETPGSGNTWKIEEAETAEKDADSLESAGHMTSTGSD